MNHLLNHLTPQIKLLEEKKLMGMSISTSLAENRTGELWSRFMPRRKEVGNPVSTELISLSVYEPGYFYSFKPTTVFEKWACVEVDNFHTVPEGMETFLLKGGLYAVFHYKGLSSDPSIFQYIYGEWLPRSEYGLDSRPHFEVLGEKYQNNHPDSEEEIWVPVLEKEYQY